MRSALRRNREATVATEILGGQSENALLMKTLTNHVPETSHSGASGGNDVVKKKSTNKPTTTSAVISLNNEDCNLKQIINPNGVLIKTNCLVTTTTKATITTTAPAMLGGTSCGAYYNINEQQTANKCEPLINTVDDTNTTSV